MKMTQMMNMRLTKLKKMMMMTMKNTVMMKLVLEAGNDVEGHLALQDLGKRLLFPRIGQTIMVQSLEYPLAKFGRPGLNAVLMEYIVPLCLAFMEAILFPKEFIFH